MKRFATVALIVLATLAVGAQESPDWFVGKTIVEIQFEGVKHADTKLLDKATEPFIGKPWTVELWIDLQQAVLQLDFFEDDIKAAAIPVPTDREAMIIRFTVVEKPWIEKIRIEGNTGISAGDIEQAIGIEVGTIFNSAKLSRDLEAIRALYRKRGYANATIGARVDPQPNGSVVVVFQCDEGAKAIIVKIVFQGVKSVNENTIKAEMELKEAALFQEGAFDAAKLESDKAKILALFRSRGFINVAIVEVKRDETMNEKDRRKEIVLTFVIDEGRQYYFGNYDFVGNVVFDTQKLLSLTTLVPGAVFNLSKFERDRMVIQELYASNGYLMSMVKPEVRFDEEKSIIYISFQIVEGERAHIEKIIIKGNKKTSEEVIRRELPFEEGDIFSVNKIREGLRNLANLQYFKDLGVQPEIGSQDNLAILTIIVEEQSTSDIRFGGTLSGMGQPGQFPISGTIKWADSNFLGTGRQFSIESNLAFDTQELIFAYMDKWLFDIRLSGGVNFTASHQRVTGVPTDIMGPVFSDADQDAGIAVPDPYTTLAEYQAANYMVPAEYTMTYDLYKLQLGLSSGYAWSFPFAMLGVSGGYSIDISTVDYDETVFRPFKKEVRANHESWLIANALFAGVYMNALDIWYDPSDGWFASQKFSITGFFEGEPQHFLQTTTKAQAFATLIDVPVFEGWDFKLVIGTYGSLTALLQQPWRPDLAVTTGALYLDGHFNARGWNLYGADLGGTTMLDWWIELRMPVFEGVLSFDAFFEVAALLNSDKGALNLAGLLDSAYDTWDIDKFGIFDLDLSNFAFSMGFGLRLSIPQLPLRLYLAKTFCFTDSGSVLWGNGPISGWDLVFSITQPLN